MKQIGRDQPEHAHAQLDGIEFPILPYARKPKPKPNNVIPKPNFIGRGSCIGSPTILKKQIAKQTINKEFIANQVAGTSVPVAANSTHFPITIPK
jgi:hypothetical protein